MKRRRIIPRPEPRPLAFLITMGVVGLLVLFCVARVGKVFIEKKSETKSPANNVAIIEQICLNADSLTGVCFAQSEEAADGRVVGVMIDNSSQARPQEGLGKAGLVFETIAEFPYTRFLLFYSSVDNLPKKIGPVRSARQYFVEWADEFDAMYAHCGGSPDALEGIKTLAVRDLNEFYNQQYFYRSWTKSAPHNVFTGQKLLAEALKNKKWEDAAKAFDLWQFKSDALPDARPESQEIKIDFGSSAFSVEWAYDRVENEYERFQGGTDVNLAAKNIAVMYVESKVVDNVGRRTMKIIGEGDAVVFFDGTAIKGKWRRADEASRTKFYNESGAEIAFNRGNTWIEAVPLDMPEVKY